MRSLTAVLTCSIFLLTSFSAIAQRKNKRYVRKNRKAPVVTYGDSGIYARGLYVDTGVIFLGNSNGAIYLYDTETDKSRLVSKFPDFTEVRDLEHSGKYLFGMQSGTDGRLVKIGPKGPVGFVDKPEWKGVFFDAMDFHGKTGFIMGDPVDSLFTLFHTKNGGKTWTRCEGSVKAFKGEAGFAASGSNVHIMNDSTYMFISGGMKSNFYKSTDSGATWKKVELPYYPEETIGAYSMCFKDSLTGVIVGGSYKQPSLRMNTTYFTSDGGETWYNTQEPPGGYRSCVYYVNDVFYACGRNGIDFSEDNGKTWTPFAEGIFFAMTSVNNQLIATTRDGKFYSFDLIEP